MRQAFSAFLLLGMISSSALAEEAVVLFGDKTFKTDARIDGENVWTSPTTLKEVTGLELKPEGVCFQEVCIPISRSKSDELVSESSGPTEVNLTRLAEKLGQRTAMDRENKVLSLGPIPVKERPAYESAIAPDFAIPDRKGKVVKLSDFRGKKVFLFTWASWCGCKLDLPGWEGVYKELKPQGLEMISAAEDTGGEEAAGVYYDRAKVTFTALVDPKHTISTLYHMVNVPMGVWIDEQGKIVRPAEVAYSRNVALMQIKVEGKEYVNALRDWVKNGEKSQYHLSEAELKKKFAPRSADENLADVYFKLGVYFQEQKKPELAKKYWAKAQALNPDSWNYHRQDWSYTPNIALSNWMKKVRALNGKTYYPPLELGSKEKP